MNIELTKTLVAGIFSALIVGGSAVHAGGKAGGVVKSLEPSVDGVESVVVAIKSSPVMEVVGEDEDVFWEVDEAGTETACVAIQIGMNLLMPELQDCQGNTVADMSPSADEVKLFLTLEGVRVVGPDIFEADPLPMCTTPCGPKPLTGLLNAFASMPGSDVVVCPLCWNTRYGPCDPDDPETTCPNVGEVAGGVGIHDLFLYADKVIDF